VAYHPISKKDDVPVAIPYGRRWARTISCLKIVYTQVSMAQRPVSMDVGGPGPTIFLSVWKHALHSVVVGPLVQ
jgi:hypothetical protein